MVLELKTDNQTIINDVNFEYDILMNELNKAVISITGNTTFQNNLLAIGNYIEIYRDGTLEFRGKRLATASAELDGGVTIQHELEQVSMILWTGHAMRDSRLFCIALYVMDL